MNQRARTKIVATIGPASSTPERIEALIDAGISVFRLNFSHGTHDAHEASFRAIRDIAARKGRAIGILQDLQGPKLRIGELVEDASVHLEAGETFRICTRPILGTSEMASTAYERFGRDLAAGDPVLIDDGRLRFEVTGIDLDTDYGDIVSMRVHQGGELSPRKGINLPRTHVTEPALTDKDREDLEFGLGLGVDLVALSFVRQAEDLHGAQEFIRAAGNGQPLIAKIEKPQAVQHLPSIIAAADGVMVARGDLGVEMPPEEVPLIQKMVIRQANMAGKPVITATQMLESMMANPVPTRAEANDVANAILDGTDAVMLSGETAVGDYPVEAVRTMASIARTVERDRVGTAWELSRVGIRSYENQTEAMAVGHAARALADDLRARAVVVLTLTGGTARSVSLERPREPIIAFTEDATVGRRLSLWHGVEPVIIPLESTIDALVRQVDRETVRLGAAEPGDRIVIVGANPHRQAHPAVFIEVHTIAGDTAPAPTP
jgi:pyruvate kinase